MSARQRWEDRIGEHERRVRDRHNSVEHGGGGGDNGGMDDLAPRVAVLEHIAKDTAEVLKEIRADLRDIRKEAQDFRKDMAAEFKSVRSEGLKVALWLLGAGTGAFAALIGIMAHGFKWF